MADKLINPPPRTGNVNFDNWFYKFWSLVTSSGATSVSATKSNTVTNTVQAFQVQPTTITTISSTDSDLLTADQATDLTDGGDSSAHYHSSDRNRANHTGTQSASTISDLANAVRNVAGTIQGPQGEQGVQGNDGDPYGPAFTRPFYADDPFSCGDFR